jgi:hypothetical protein
MDKIKNNSATSQLPIQSMMQAQMRVDCTYLTRPMGVLEEYQEEFKNTFTVLKLYNSSLNEITPEHFSLFDSDDVSPEKLDQLSMEMEYLHRQLNSYQQGWDSGFIITLLLKDGRELKLPPYKPH